VIELVLATLSAAAAVQAAPAFDTSGWAWERPIETGISSPGFVRAPIDLEMMGESQPSLSDLRVLDSNRNLVPHVVDWGRAAPEERREWREVTLLNRTFQPNEYERTVLDFGRPVRKNRIEIDVSGNNYRRRVSIEGSTDGTRWENIISEGLIFDVDLNGRAFAVNTIDFPPNDFRYLRLTVYHAPDDPERITVRGVKAEQFERLSEKELVAVPVQEMTETYDDEKSKSVYELDLGYRNVPVGEVKIATSEPFYHRRYELCGRNALTEKIDRKTETGWDIIERDVPWRHVRRGFLYRVFDEDRPSEHSSIEGLSGAYRYLQLSIFEGDNPRLGIDGIDVLRREVSLVFDYKPGNVYTLIGGNPEAGPARYDLVQAFGRVHDMELPIVDVGAVSSIAGEPEPEPWSERHGVLLLCLVVVAAASMCVIVIRSLRQI